MEKSLLFFKLIPPLRIPNCFSKSAAADGELWGWLLLHNTPEQSTQAVQSLAEDSCNC